MRNGQNKRMRGRNHHHRKNQNPLTRVYESNGPDVKIRGTASHVAEKYVQLARDAMASGDPVTAENYHQHAEHYFRLITAAQEQFRQQNPYYRPEGEMQNDNSDGTFDDADDGVDQPMQGEPNVGNQQPYPPRDAQPYAPRESQPYGGRDQQPQQQGRPQHQQHQHHQPHHQQHQPHQPQDHPQQHQQPHQPAGTEGTDGDRLPSFITGSQPQQNPGPNGYDNQGGDRYQMHRRRRRHRGQHRQDIQGGTQGASGGDAPDDSRPGND